MLDRYADDEVMLDALWLIACAPRVITESGLLDSIKTNLALRFSSEQVDRVCHELHPLQDHLSARGRAGLKEALQGRSGDPVRRGVRGRLASNLPALCMLAILEERGLPPWSETLYGPLCGLVRAALGEELAGPVPGYAELTELLVTAGALHRLVWFTDLGILRREVAWGLTPGLSLRDLLEEYGVAIPGCSSYVEHLFSRGLMDQLRLVETVVASRVGAFEGVLAVDGAPPEWVPAAGIIGFDSEQRDGVRYVAVNPLAREPLGRALAAVRGRRLDEWRAPVGEAVRAVAGSLGEGCALSEVVSSPARVAWKLQPAGLPQLFVLLGTWLSEQDMAELRQRGLGGGDCLLALLTDGGLVPQEGMPSVCLCVPAADGSFAEPQLVQGESHPLVAEVWSRLVQPGLLAGSRPARPAWLLPALGFVAVAVLLGALVWGSGSVHRAAPAAAPLPRLVEAPPPAPVPPPVTVPVASPSVVETYVIVRPGDTLERLAQELYGDWQQYPRLAAANGLKPPYPLSPGQRLRVPQAE